MYSKDELLAKSPEELETIAKALGSNLTAADGVEALASYIIGDFDFDAEKEEKPKRKTRTKTTVSDEEPTEEAPKKKRGRPSKKALEEAAALAAQKAQEELEQITETEASTPEEGTEEIVPVPERKQTPQFPQNPRRSGSAPRFSGHGSSFPRPDRRWLPADWFSPVHWHRK